jgi:hypothetical protein
MIRQLWERLKNHWKITSNIQVAIILLTFALSGFSTLYVHNYIDFLLGVDEESDFWIKVLIFVLMVLPIFNLFLFVWGTLLGQQKFVIRFIRTKINLLVQIFK